MTACRGIPGNIGTLMASVVIYDHNPFWARPHQNLVYPFSEAAGAQIAKKNPEDKNNVVFNSGGDACLNWERDLRYSNFVATVKTTTEEVGPEWPGEFLTKLDIAKGKSTLHSMYSSILPKFLSFQYSLKTSIAFLVPFE